MTTSRPILMSGPMVRAYLAGRKTQTRRIVKPTRRGQSVYFSPDNKVMMEYRDGFGGYELKCPYGREGDELWVKETHAWVDELVDVEREEPVCVGYRADHAAIRHERDNVHALDPSHWNWEHESVRWRPSIHMPRWASRINLQVLSVRVERVQDISEEDAIAEGVEYQHDKKEAFAGWYSVDRTVLYPTAKRAYQNLWNAINMPPTPVLKDKKVVAYESYPWSAEDFDAAYPDVRASGLYRGKPITVVPNPWVWCISFPKFTPQS